MLKCTYLTNLFRNFDFYNLLSQMPYLLICIPRPVNKVEQSDG